MVIADTRFTFNLYYSGCKILRKILPYLCANYL
jgi:hypothetical protein